MKVIKININSEEEIVDDYQTFERFLIDKIKSWWSFENDLEIDIKLKGIENNSPTLGIQVNDSVQFTERTSGSTNARKLEFIKDVGSHKKGEIVELKNQNLHYKFGEEEGDIFSSPLTERDKKYFKEI